MKTPKEKAKELVEKFTDIENKYKEYTDFKQAKQCALTAVDEMINYLLASDWTVINNKAKYWQEVKTKINNL